jgi:hemolysin III
MATGRHFSPVLSTCVYLGLGWGVVACYRELERAVSRRAMLPIAAGGMSYSVGAVLNVLRWPVLWPGVFGAHELFHLFVVVGSLAHYWFMLKVIVPFVRKPWDASRVPSPRTARLNSRRHPWKLQTFGPSPAGGANEQVTLPLA